MLGIGCGTGSWGRIVGTDIILGGKTDGCCGLVLWEWTVEMHTGFPIGDKTFGRVCLGTTTAVDMVMGGGITGTLNDPQHYYKYVLFNAHFVGFTKYLSAFSS